MIQKIENQESQRASSFKLSNIQKGQSVFLTGQKQSQQRKVVPSTNNFLKQGIPFRDDNIIDLDFSEEKSNNPKNQGVLQEPTNKFKIYPQSRVGKTGTDPNPNLYGTPDQHQKAVLADEVKQQKTLWINSLTHEERREYDEIQQQKHFNN